MKMRLETIKMGCNMLVKRQLGVRKIFNLFVNTIAYLLKRPPLKYPSVLLVDTGNVCNLRCTDCFTGRGLHPKPTGIMSLDNFKRIVDDVKSSTSLVLLYVSGEPFLNPSIYEMIEYLTENRIASIISTNGHFLETDEKAEKLVRSGLYMLIVSLSGASQEVYEKYHREGNLKLVVENIKRVVKAKKKLKKRTPKIKLRFLVMDHNKHELEQMKKLYEEVGADALDFRYTQIHKLVKDDPDGNENSQSSKATVNKTCYWPWFISVIHWEGTVIPCCFYYLRVPDLGNVFHEGGMKGVWWGSAYKKFREIMIQGTSQIPVCKYCLVELGFQEEFGKTERKFLLHEDVLSKIEKNR